MGYYVVVDLEMCRVPAKMRKEYRYRHEIIQIGAALMDENLNVVDKFSEYVKPQYGYLDDFISKLDSSVVSYTPDPAHLFAAGADYLAYFKKYAGQMTGAYFTDTKFKDKQEAYKTISPEFPQDGEAQRVYWDLGYGDIDFKEIMKVLKDNNFNGPVILESKYSLDIPKGILRLRTFWNRLEKA